MAAHVSSLRRRLWALLNPVLTLLFETIPSSNNILVVVLRKVTVNVLALYALVLMSSVPLWPADVATLTLAEESQLANFGAFFQFGKAAESLNPFILGLGPFITTQIMVRMFAGSVGLGQIPKLPAAWKLTRAEAGTRDGGDKVCPP